MNCKLLLHPIIRNYWMVRQLEQQLHCVAVARSGYVELVRQP